MVLVLGILYHFVMDAVTEIVKEQEAEFTGKLGKLGPTGHEELYADV